MVAVPVGFYGFASERLKDFLELFDTFCSRPAAAVSLVQMQHTVLQLQQILERPVQVLRRCDGLLRHFEDCPLCAFPKYFLARSEVQCVAVELLSCFFLSLNCDCITA